MRVDDWMDKAAEEIVASYPRGTRARHVRSVIAKHCPFKSDTVYVPLVAAETGHIQDWATRAAGYIAAGDQYASVHRLAAIISYFAKPIVELLRQTIRQHNDSDIGTCKKVLTIGDSDDVPCTCGADEWNKKIEKVLA